MRPAAEAAPCPWEWPGQRVQTVLSTFCRLGLLTYASSIEACRDCSKRSDVPNVCGKGPRLRPENLEYLRNERPSVCFARKVEKAAIGRDRPWGQVFQLAKSP